jgi:hypothetical protein
LARLTNHSPGSGQLACLAPKLRIIDVRYHSDFDDLAFINMIESRWRLDSHMDDREVTVERIKKVKVTESRDWIVYDPEDPLAEALKRLASFREEGLEFKTYK